MTDPRTPVLVGVGQYSERLGESDYLAISPVDLAAEAARRALADGHVDIDVAIGQIDTIAAIRQFENSHPSLQAPLGRSDNFPRSVAQRLRADPKRAILDVVGGHTPQRLVTEVCAEIRAGGCDVALVVGSEAMSTIRHLLTADERPDFTEQIGGELDDRGFGLDGLLDDHLLAHGLVDMPTQYALFEHARRARLKQSRADYAAGMGELFAPFTRIAAGNPHAAAGTVRTPAELITATGRNRLIADPYLRFLVARDQVNQAAAVLVTSVAAATRLGIDPEKWVYLAGHADLRERELLDRPDLGASPAAVTAVRHALDVAGKTHHDLRTIDLYSCFPIAVSVVCDGIGLDPDDPRGLTVTGGLPFFGGPGNNYSMHAIADTVVRMRRQPGDYGLVGANGGALSKYSAGVYTTTPTEWQPDRSVELQAELDARPTSGKATEADGWATIETYTVRPGQPGTVIGRLERDDRRFVALTDDVAMLTDADPLGARVRVRPTPDGNRVDAG